MKVQQSNQLINPFGGIQFVLKQIKEHSIDKFIEEIKTLNERILSRTCGIKLPSADTALRIMQELKTEDSIIKNGDVTHTFHYHEKLNDCLQKLALKVKAITPEPTIPLTLIM